VLATSQTDGRECDRLPPRLAQSSSSFFRTRTPPINVLRHWHFALSVTLELVTILRSTANRLIVMMTETASVALMTDGADSLLRSKTPLRVPTRFVLYFRVSMKRRHLDQCIGAISPIVAFPRAAPSLNSLTARLSAQRAGRYESLCCEAV
jgi:hypothetical protein